MERRDFIHHAILGLAGTAAVTTVGKQALANIPEPIYQPSAATAPPWRGPETDGDRASYRPVVTLNGWTLPYRLREGVKEFHLVAEPVVREMAPGFRVNMWGYNGQSPGPTIEVVEGDRVRIFVTNRLPEKTTIHWHGQRLPNGMDGVSGLNQPPIPVGKTFVYEFIAKRPGTFMYHPHADETTQMAMGMMGFWVTHPKAPNPHINTVDRDYCILLNAFDVEPGSKTPKVTTMLDFNIWSFNSRVYPGLSPLVAKLGDRVRIRIGNLTMTSHPFHVHGVEFEVTGTDGGPVPVTARWPEVTASIAVGQMRQIEFIADELGDWAVHCHKSHHTMGAMGHDVPTMIGINHQGLVGRLQKVVPEYMLMGERGMYDMKEMEMELPANTIPMMAGTGPYGPIGMGGMFTTLKVREDLKADDYSDPGWYKQPPGTQAYEFKGTTPPVTRSNQTGSGASTNNTQSPSVTPDGSNAQVRKPGQSPNSAHKH